MSAPLKLTAEQDEEIRRLYAAGSKVAELAEKYGVSEPTIYKRVRPPKPPKPRTPVIPSLCGRDDCGSVSTAATPTLPVIAGRHDEDSRGFCSWHCLSRHAIRCELAGGDTP